MALADTLKTDLNAPITRQSDVYEKETIAPLREKYTKSLESEQKVAQEKEIRKSKDEAKLSKQMADYGYLQGKELEPIQQKYQDAVDKKSAAAYIPDQENPERLATILAITNLLGVMVGGKGKNSAQTALSAQNGMLEGYQQGRADIIKQQKSVFDENQKQLDKTIENLHRGFQEAMALAPVAKEAAHNKALQTINEENADFLRELYNKTGLVGASKSIGEALKQAEKLRGEMRKEEDKMIITPKEQQHLDLETERLAELKRHHGVVEDKQGRGATQQQAMAQRAVNALGGVASAVESIKELPAGTTTGLLPNLQTKDGMINYVRNAAGRKITSADAEMMNTLFTGIGRNLATIEGSGVATGLGELSKQMQSGVYINAGTDDPYKVAIKLADIRRIASENIQPAIDSGLMPESQRDTAEKLVKRIQEAIPFTTVDVVKAHNKGRATIGEAAQGVVQPGKKYASEAEAEQAFKAGTLKSGEKVNIGGVTGTWE